MLAETFWFLQKNMLTFVKLCVDKNTHTQTHTPVPIFRIFVFTGLNVSAQGQVYRVEKKNSFFLENWVCNKKVKQAKSVNHKTPP